MLIIQGAWFDVYSIYVMILQVISLKNYKILQNIFSSILVKYYMGKTCNNFLQVLPIFIKCLNQLNSLVSFHTLSNLTPFGIPQYYPS